MMMPPEKTNKNSKSCKSDLHLHEVEKKQVYFEIGLRVGLVKWMATNGLK